MNASTIEISARGEPALRRAPSGHSFQLAAVSLLFAVALGLRMWALDNIAGVNGDEAWSGVQALRLVHGEPIAWTTPTGNPVNWLFLLPTAALHAVFAPSFWLLRLTSLASGVLALVANYWLCARVFDRRTAVVSTLLVALAPVNIAYSRFAWDTSQTLLVTTLVLYLPLWQIRNGNDSSWQWTAAMIALALAMLVHPTNVFAAPLVIVPLAWQHRRELRKTLRNTKVPGNGWLLASFAALVASAAYLVWHWGIQQGRLHGPSEWSEFMRNYLGLLSGTTVFTYISGADVPTTAAPWSTFTVWLTGVGFWCLAAVAAVGVAGRLSRPSNPLDATLVVSWAVMLVGFFVVAGPRAVAPHFERYGLCLVAPTMLLMARGLGWWLFESAWPNGARRALTVASMLWVASFAANYFVFFQQTGGESHRAFRTAAVEPKRQAIDYVLASRDPARPTRVVCDSWWTYWPTAYLAFGHEGVDVMTRESWQAAADADESGQTWFVDFVDGTGSDESRPEVQSEVPRHLIRDYGGRLLIVVVGPLEKSSQNY